MTSPPPVDAGAPFRAWWDNREQVLRGNWAPGAVIGTDEAKTSTAAVREVGRGAVPLLVDLREVKRLDRGAREHYKLDKGGATAMALLVDSPVTKMIANFFMRTDSSDTPTRMFSDETAAISWLHSQA